MLTQGSKKFSRFKKFEIKDLKPATPHNNMMELAKKKGKKKKKSRGQKQEYTSNRKE